MLLTQRFERWPYKNEQDEPAIDDTCRVRTHVPPGRLGIGDGPIVGKHATPS